MASTIQQRPNTAAPPTRPVPRPIASPTALGFLALAGASIVLSGLELGWYSPAESTVVGLVVLLFAFPAQLVASIFGFLSRDGVVATALGVLAAAWLTTGVVRLLSAPSSLSMAHGTVLMFAGVALLVPALIATLGELVPGLVLLLAAARFVLTGYFEMTADETVRTSSGIAGLVLVVVALLAALMVMLREFRGTDLVPAGQRVDQAQQSTSPDETLPREPDSTTTGRRASEGES